MVTTSTQPPKDGRRFLFFTNECVGLGHLRRTMNLANAVTEHDASASALVITGASSAMAERRSSRIDIVKLPELARTEAGTIHAARLGVHAPEVHGLRANLALTAALCFSPDVVVVDKTPLGLGDELLPTLEALHGAHSKTVLGLRDIEDSPENSRRRWANTGVQDAIARLYDTVMVYGPESSSNVIECLGLTDLAIPVEHVGYVGAPMPDSGPADLDPGYLLVTAGGGADGFPMFDAVLDALGHDQLDLPVVMVTGPLMRAEERDRLARRSARLGVRCITSRSDMPAVIMGARAVVTMAGYNTVSEVIRAGKPTLLMPRTGPSLEQLVRATGLEASGVAAMLTLDQATPARLAAELRGIMDRVPPTFDPELHRGAARAAEVLCALAGQAPRDSRPMAEVA